MAVSPTDSLQRRRQRAINKAIKERTWTTVEPMTTNEWMVRGEDTWYCVFVDDDGSLGCTCRAAELKLRECYHRAGLWLAQAHDMAGTSRAN